ncbi:MSMEG_0567/Sll0786 family nitrogen starvation N-acetyltransferase [Pseudonocardia spinosispora]|uniref:MSMEG_0567/Sll0786 family nitrogen starvation N-acetyltransferase n=1 Tax=Pseudonocardia spinosispora TaxID=103441 RepID=UPI00040EC116|nr:MSMEG_0567/Sll0786 family nitrogen starvation N-acetyltransferase [Pseudonocardia spinosispora]
MTTSIIRSSHSVRAGHDLHCQLVDTTADLHAHLAVRRAVFVAEQSVFAESDTDSHDVDPATIHVLGLVDGVPAGAVRLFPLDPTEPRAGWQGDRLAVLPEFRTSGLGAPLVRFAVATAGALGGRTMLAHIQPANRTFFRRLGWTQLGGTEIYVGLPHLLMEIDLHTHPDDQNP